MIPASFKILAKGSRTNFLVIRHHNTCIGISTFENDVASALPIYDEPRALEQLDQLLAGQVRR